MAVNMSYGSKIWKINILEDNESSEKTPVAFTLSTDKTYAVQLDGCRKIISVAAVFTNSDEKQVIRPKFIFFEGYMNVMVRAQEEQDDILVDDILRIDAVNVEYVKANRSGRDIFKKMNREYGKSSPESVTFSLDVPKFDSIYKITVLIGEFVSLAIKNDETIDGKTSKKNKTLFGSVVGITDSEVIFCRYLYHKGIRDMRDTYHVKADDILGIYRYSLVVNDTNDKADSNDVDSVDTAIDDTNSIDTNIDWDSVKKEITDTAENEK